MAPKAGKLSLLFGLVTGTLAGLLFAPSKGEQLRKQINKERKEGGLGHKAVGKELTKMADDISHLVKDVAHSKEAKAFWLKTKETVSDLTEGNVDLNEWVKESHQKADSLKRLVTRYATERKKQAHSVGGAACEVAKALKSKAKTATRKVAKRIAEVKENVQTIKGKKLKSISKKSTSKRKSVSKKPQKK